MARMWCVLLEGESGIASTMRFVTEALQQLVLRYFLPQSVFMTQSITSATRVSRVN